MWKGEMLISLGSWMWNVKGMIFFMSVSHYSILYNQKKASVDTDCIYEYYNSGSSGVVCWVLGQWRTPIEVTSLAAWKAEVDTQLST